MCQFLSETKQPSKVFKQIDFYMYCYFISVQAHMTLLICSSWKNYDYHIKVTQISIRHQVSWITLDKVFSCYIILMRQHKYTSWVQIIPKDWYRCHKLTNISAPIRCHFIKIFPRESWGEKFNFYSYMVSLPICLPTTHFSSIYPSSSCTLMYISFLPIHFTLYAYTS